MRSRIIATGLVAAVAAGLAAGTAGSKPLAGATPGGDSIRALAAADAAAKEHAALVRHWAQWDRAHGRAWARGVAQAEARAAAQAREERVLHWAQRERIRLAAEAHTAAVHAALVRLYSHYDGIKYFGDAPAPLPADSVAGGHGGT